MAQRPRAEYVASAVWAPWAHVLPAWTASGSNPSIGDGTIIGACRRIGTTGFYRGAVTMGSSTTFGTGEWRVALPDGWVAATSITNGYQSGLAECYQASTTGAGCYVVPGGTVLNFWYGSARLSVTASAPAGWAANHFLTWNITLELDNS